MSVSRPTSESSTASIAPTPDVPNIGWYGLVMNKRQDLIEYCQETLIQLQRVSAQWQDEIPAITAFISNMSEKLELLQRVHPSAGSQSTWSQFFTELRNCINDLSTFSQILADKTNTTPQIIASFIERIRTWPALIKAFNNLELDLIANGLFESFSKHVADIEKQAASFSIKNILPPYQFKKIEESLSWLEKNLDESFSKSPETAQDAVLIMASQFNTIFRHAYLAIDKFASQMDFNTQKLLDEPIFNIGNTAQHGEEEKGNHPGTLSFHQLAMRFTALYSASLTRAGYEWHEEYYPFPSATLSQRKEYPLGLANQHVLEIENEGQRWKKAKLECVTIIEARLRELRDEYSAMWTSGGVKKENMKQLEELINHLPETDTDVEIAIRNGIKTPNHADVHSTLNKIRAVYNNAISRKTNRQKWFEKQKQNFKELIAEAEENNKNVSPVRPHPSVVSEILSVEVAALAGNTQALVATLMRKNNDGSDETVFDTVLNTMQQCEQKFQEILDPGIYTEWFENDILARVNIKLKLDAAGIDDENADLVQTEIEVNSAWLFRIAQLIKKIKFLANEANILQAKSIAEKKARTTPGLHFQETLQKLNKTVVSLTAAMKQLNALRDHPMVQALPPIGAMLGMALPTIQEKFQQTVAEPLSDHPVQQAWGDREDFASPNDKLTGGLQILRKIFLSLLQKSDKDPAMKLIAKHGMDEADELLAAFQNTKSMTAFLFKQPRQLYKFIKSIGDLFSSVMTLSGDQLLLAAKKMNDALRQLFVLFDKLEIQFYLKDKYFVNLISVNNQSLLELGKLFSDTMKEQGYIFKPGECFPYTEAILAQRRELLSTAQHADKVTERFITARIDQSVAEINAQNKLAEEELSAHKAAFKAEALKKIGTRQLELINANATACIPSATKTKKAALLERVATNLRESNSIHIRLGMFTSQERALLWDGKTGEMLKSLLYYTKDHFMADVKNLGDKLKSRQKSSWGLFSSPLVFLKKLDAVEALASWLRLPGYRIDDALKELKESNFAAYQILDKNKKELLTPLREFEKYIPNFLIGKKVIGLTPNNNVSTTTNNVSIAENSSVPVLVNQAPVSQAPVNANLFDEADIPASVSLHQPLLSSPRLS